MSARSIRFDEFSKNGPARIQIMLQPQHRIRDLTCPRPGDADDPDSAAPWRGRDGNDGIVEVHGAIEAGKLNNNQRSNAKAKIRAEVQD